MKKRMLSFLMIGLLVFQNFQIVYADDIEMSPNTEQQIEVTIKEDSSNEESVNEFEDESEAIIETEQVTENTEQIEETNEDKIIEDIEKPVEDDTYDCSQSGHIFENNICTVCGYQEIIEKTDEDKIIEDIEKSAENDTYDCSQSGHIFENNICTACGYQEIIEETNIETVKEVQTDVNYIGKNIDDIPDIDFNNSIIVQYVFSDQQEGTVLNQYNDIDELGNPVTVLEVAMEEIEGIEPITTFNLLSAFELSDNDNNDGYPDWNSLPTSYEFNWDKQDAWINGEHYTDPNSTDVRNGIQLYSDGDRIYLHIIYSRENTMYGNTNGSDFNFVFGSQQAKFQLWDNGTINGNNYEPGAKVIEVRNGDGSISHYLANGATATYIKDGNHINDEVMLSIPMDAFLEQNPNINPNCQEIKFYCPNLTSGTVSCAGASSAPGVFAFITFGFLSSGYYLAEKKKKIEVENV